MNKKCFALCLLLLLVSVVARADMMFMGSENYHFTVSAGAAWYHDNRPIDRKINYDPPPMDDWALYVQTPVVGGDNFDICFGGICPVNHAERARPEFSVCWHGERLEVGVYLVMNAWIGRGVMIGWRF